MADRRYRAFISYSHRDKRIANWLHSALETYRLPPKAVAEGKPARLHPIFKDREELPAADSLGEAIEQAIRCSDALIVLCSPAAAQSPWIAREVDLYKRINGDHAVFPVIVEGDPPGNFPAPLLERYENGEPTGEAAEPIAADLRRHADGRKLGKLKLVAGLAGVDLDGLVQRDAARRQRRLALVAAASVVGMVGTSGLALYAIDQRNDAREQRAEADGLIEYMLTDLRQQLEPVGRLEVLDGVGKRAMDYYARQKLGDLSDRELGRRAKATMLVAEVQNLRGNNEDALPAFEQAARTTEALLERNPDDPEAMFNHGQSLFWVGYIAWQHGKMDEARAALEEYAEVSRRLAAKDRGNLEWQMEEAYSLSNLGTMDFEDGNLSSALDYFQRNLAAVEAIEGREEGPESRAAEKAEALSWISSVLSRMGRVEDAIAARQAELDIYDRVLKRDPANNGIRRANVFAAGTMGSLLAVTGNKAKARTYLDAAVAEGEKQIAADPENTLSQELLQTSLHTRAMLHAQQGDIVAARRDAARHMELIDGLIRRDPANTKWSIVEKGRSRLLNAMINVHSARPDSLLEVSRTLVANFGGEKHRDLRNLAAAHLVAAVAHLRKGERAQADAAFKRAMNPPQEGEAFDFSLAALRAVAAERGGNPALARSLRDELARRGIDPMIDDLF